MTNTILIKGRGIRKEALAAAIITPGYLIERIAAGTFQKHAGAGLNTSPLFAEENELFGKGIDDDYPAGDQVLAQFCVPGCEINAVLAANAAAIVIGDFLESAGDGTLRIATADVATDTAQREAMVAVALEAVDNSAGGTEVRIKVEVV